MTAGKGSRCSPERGARHTLLSGVASTALLLGLAVGSAAQAQPLARGTAIEEVVVTARRVNERLQDVPASIAAIGAQELQKRQIQSLLDIKQIVPNLAIQETAVPGGGTIAIRGIATNGLPSASIDYAVGRYVDGVYIARLQGASFDVADIARVEVLRGPQGTLFGRNVTVGAINFITPDPTGEFRADFEAGAGSRNRQRIRVAADLPSVGGLSVRFAVLHSERDGDVRNLSSGRSYLFPNPVGRTRAASTFGARNNEAYFLAARYTGLEHLTLTYKFDASNEKGTPQVTQAFGYPSGFSGMLQAGLYLSQPANSGVSFHRLDAIPQDFQGDSRVKTQGHNLTAEYQISDTLRLKSITAYRKLHARAETDEDGGDFVAGPTTYICAGCLVDILSQHQFSEEVQLIAKTSRFDAIAGAYYFRESSHMFAPYGSGPFYILAGTGVPGKQLSTTTLNPITPYDQIAGTFSDPRAKSQAVYGHLTFHVTDTFELAGGLRYTEDKRRNRVVTLNITSPFPLVVVPVTETRSVKEDNTSFDVSGTYKFSPDVNVYARYATAYLSGGLQSITPYNPEKTRSIEAGLKSEWLDRRLRLNLSIFQVKTTNLQVGGFRLDQGVIITNIGAVRSKGLELESTFSPWSGVILGANLGYNKPDYSDGRRNIAPKFNTSLSAEYNAVKFSNGAQLSVRVDGNYRSTYYPNIPFPLAADATGPLPAAFVTAQGYATEGAYLAALDRASRAGDYWLLNLNASVTDIPGPNGSRLRLTAWAKNLTNQRGVLFTANYGNFIGGAFEEARSVGVDLALSF
jgi:iron complex outermembrane receptor protein